MANGDHFAEPYRLRGETEVDARRLSGGDHHLALLRREANALCAHAVRSRGDVAERVHPIASRNRTLLRSQQQDGSANERLRRSGVGARDHARDPSRGALREDDPWEDE
jgi:hypothetical protein